MCFGSFEAGLDVLGYGHGGEEGVVLEEVADVSFLGFYVCVALGIVVGSSVDLDAALVWGFYSCDASQGHAFSGAGWSQYADSFGLALKLYV